MHTIAAAMTSPQTATTEVIATAAATGIDDSPPNLNLTANMAPATEIDALTALGQEEHRGTLPPDENEAVNNVGEDAGEQQIHQESAPPKDATTPNPIPDGLPNDSETEHTVQQAGDIALARESFHSEDAAIPQLNHDGLPASFELPIEAQMAGLDALMAMGHMESFTYDPNLPLSQAPGLEMAMLPVSNQDIQWGNNPEGYVPDSNRPEDRLIGYAKLVFEDGEFYMNTHSVVLGRDAGAYRAAQRREKEETRRRTQRSTPGAPRTPVQIKREHTSYNRSVFSEKSGILRDGNDSDPEAREKRRLKRKASKKSKSTGSSQEISRRSSLAQLPPKPHIYEAQYPGRIKQEDAVPVDPQSLRPDPNECPIIPLHPSANAGVNVYKSISREHVKIAYNAIESAFEMHIYGRNGAFVNDVYHPMNDTVELKSGDMLQIGTVPIEFVLPDGLIGDAQGEYDDVVGADTRSGGKEMSFDFEDDKRNGIPDDSSSELVSNEGEGEDDEDDVQEVDEDGEGLEVDDDEDEGAEVSDEDQDQSGLMERDEEGGVEEQENHQESVVPSKKRGPGRPPKNGIMSAREEREQKAAMKAALGNQKVQKSQKSVSQPTSAPTTEKKKVGRPRKHEKPDPTEPERPKRKYTKRKPKEPKEGEAKQEGEEGEDEATKEKKELKKLKPPRSPSPTFDESKLKPEELQKPQANYVTLIYEALSNSKEGKLSLPQIYRAIQRKYPYFVLKVGTLGWQSSVRHNLSQHHAFEKVERDGKGWMWGIVEGVSIEKEKKRRTPPPPQMGGPMHQPIYQAGQPPYMGHGPYPYPPPAAMGYPGYMPRQMMSGPPQPGQPQHYMGLPPHMNGPLPPSQSQPPVNINPGLAAAMIPQLAPARKGGYSSPYAPTPSTAQPTEQKPPDEQQPPAQDPPPQIPPSSSQPPSEQVCQSQQVQSQPPQGQPPQASQPPAATQQPSAPFVNHLSELPQHSQQVIKAAEVFRDSMLKSTKDTHPNSEEIINSAVNQVLGYTDRSSLPGNPLEENIIKSLRSMLEKIPGSRIASSSAAVTSNRASTPASQTNGQAPLSAQTNQNETHADRNATPQPPKTSGQEKPTPTVMRPTFTGQGQSRPNVPRPPMGTPGMKRANSGSPAQQLLESGPLAGQKRALEDAEEYKDVKRLNAAGMPTLKT